MLTTGAQWKAAMVRRVLAVRAVRRPDPPLRFNGREKPMSKDFVVATVILTLCAIPVDAQSSSGGSVETLSALLSEVRALRMAVERAASTSPQVQLLTARLAVQNERVTRASRDADAVRQDLGRVQSQASARASEAAEIEEGLSREGDRERQQRWKERLRQLKLEGDASTVTEAGLRAREGELANILAIEQAQWVELNRRFDELERQLAARTPQ